MTNPAPASGSISSPVRILFVIDSLWGSGGAERSLLRLTQSLPDCFQCQVLTFHSHEQARAFRESFPCRVHYWQLNNLYDLTALRTALRLRRLVRDQHIDIVHTFFSISDLWAGLVARLSGARILISSRRDMGILRARWHKLGYRLLGSMYDQVQAVSEQVAHQTIETDRVDPARVVIVRNGIEEGWQDARPEQVRQLRDSLGIAPGTPVISFVGNWRRVKGVDTLVRAAALVAQSVPQARFLVAGHFGANPADARFTQEVRSISREIGADRVVRFLGHCPQIPALLRISDIFVQASRSEGLSNALLEAMLTGLPCVATSVGGTAEVVLEGVTGFLVPAEDPEPLADRLVTLLRNPALRRRMGDAARDRARVEFGVDRMTSQVVAAYSDALRGKRVAALCAPEPGW
jgi:glycosyltransferase involved in cell wall biosynthesis